MPDPMNVREQWFMYDTIGVSPFVNTLAHPITGWYSTFSDFSQADNISFFDSRNKSLGLAYNNQESRDQLPYALRVETVSVGFFAPSIGTQAGSLGPNDYRGRVDTMSAFWDNELPQHTSCIFRVNQDERLKINCAMMNAGYGPVGSAHGQGDISLSGGVGSSVHASGMGISYLKYRWDFPTTIGIPRRATLVVQLQIVEWARAVLSSFWGPGYMAFHDFVPGGVPNYPTVYKPSMFMIQVLLTGKREVQQRGQYHA